MRHIARALVRNLAVAGLAALTMYAMLAAGWVSAWLIGNTPHVMP